MDENFVITAVQGLNTAVMNLLVLLLFRKIYKPKYDSKLLYFITYIFTTLLYIGANILVSKIGILILNFLYTSVYINIYCFIMYKCNYKKAFVINESFIMFGLLSEVIALGFCAIIGNNSLANILGNSQYVTIICLISILLLFVIWRIYILLLSNNGFTLLKFRQIIFFLIFTIFEAYTIDSLIFKIEDRSDGVQSIIILVGFVLLNVYIVYFIDETTIFYQKQNEYNLIQKQNQIQLDNFREISQKYEEAQKTIHDIKKHLYSLSALEHIDRYRAAEYSGIIEQKIDTLFYEFHCSNQLLSIIMSQKITVCKSEGIDVKTKIEDISFDFMEDYDITGIFANLWDNAIEASREIKTSNRLIRVIIGKVDDFIVIDFENNYSGLSRKNENKFQSTKQNHSGMGLTIIKNAIEKYNGLISVKDDDKVFRVEILIPVESKNILT